MSAAWIFVIVVFVMGVWEMCSDRKFIAGCLFLVCALVIVNQAWGQEMPKDSREISAVICDKQEEMQAAYDVHMEDQSREFDVVMEMVKQRAGSNSCASVRVTAVIEQEMQTLENGALALDRIRVYKACGNGLCMYFPKGSVSYVILKAKGNPT
jgi:hypothetical protein